MINQLIVKNLKKRKINYRLIFNEVLQKVARFKTAIFILLIISAIVGISFIIFENLDNHKQDLLNKKAETCLRELHYSTYDPNNNSSEQEYAIDKCNAISNQPKWWFE